MKIIVGMTIPAPDLAGESAVTEYRGICEQRKAVPVPHSGSICSALTLSVAKPTAQRSSSSRILHSLGFISNEEQDLPCGAST